MKNIFSSSKFKHGTMATVLSILFIAIIVGVNVGMSLLTDRFPSMNIDMSAEGLNTLSETALETANEVKVPTTINIVGKEEDIRSSAIYSGAQHSQLANIADRMAEANSLITVKYIDPDLNPDFLIQYANDNLTVGDVVVVTDLRYKVLTIDDLFAAQQDQTTGAYVFYSKVDGAVANAVHIANLEEVPVIAVATGHDELFSADTRATFDQLMKDNAFDVVEFNILTEEIPENANVLFIPTPNTDYSVEEVTKIREFLAVTTEDRSLFVTSHSTQVDMPNLDGLLEEWGVAIGEGTVVESDYNRIASAQDPTIMLVDTNEELIDTSYTRLIVGASSPIELLYDANGDIATYTLTSTSDTAYVFSEEADLENPELGTVITSSLSTRYNNTDDGTFQTKVLVSGDTVSLLSSYLGSSAFDNREYIVDVMQILTGTTESSLSIYVESTETNVLDIAASYDTIFNLGFIVFTVGLPLAILIVGLVIFIRRRHL